MGTNPPSLVEAQMLLLRLIDPGTRADPFPVYHALLDHGPMQLPGMPLTVFSSFSDCDEALRHPLAASDRLKATLAQQAIAAGAEPRPFYASSFMFLDPPDHTRLRKLVSKAFAPKVVQALEGDITALVDSLLDKGAAAGQLDVIADLAFPLAVAVICRLLGVPYEDAPEFGRVSALLVQSVDPFITITGEPPEATEERLRAGVWLRDYLEQLVKRRRGTPGDDLISRLIEVDESGDQLTEEEIVATCSLLLVAGHETTVNLIANAVLAMLRNPSQWKALGDNPQRAPLVVEETLRYDPAIHLIGRVAAEDMTIGQTALTKGDTMVLLLAAANRDPAVYSRPDEFDPDRPSSRHLAFAVGSHFCLGAALARLEATVTLSAISARFPQAQLAGELVYKPNVAMRGMSALPVQV
ncbi:cytochrome P450 [Mycobacterium haemophilum]|uniref:Cytochrome P450 n=1 Tax=Mycobacterium haemophilum TaxID=29311 RepID=A0A0I9ZSP5_9MYCO|nr:cytochrome P450 [Mycobacterium haemophilum]AKN18516.1 cytochrome [Mycobacterium haemophilum DSM 44634]KLO32459.1 cytochrome P450 [Mycobacterium haemophilum]KLO38721.1 cytochrome P450 [Mycobacterium haemophilum]KLO45038.1 cytochrome P450 [Mycobacterium haemophilum]KLO56382.1 cytochrome P450 [Mycobacterium haemophilum]